MSEHKMENPESTSMMKQRSEMETKIMRAPKKATNLKSKAKKVNSDDSVKASHKRKRTNIDNLYHDDDAKKSVMDRAEEVLKSIPADCPRFVKQMLPSNVSYSFWLHLPLDFCKTYMPREDARVTLVDDVGEEKETTFLIRPHGLSAGWRAFAIQHRLLKGDILVFHMISPCKFKVNIIRVYGLDVVDAALVLMQIHDYGDRTFSGPISCKISFAKHPLHNIVDNAAKGNRNRTKSKKRVKMLRHIKDQSERCFDDSDAEVPQDEDSGMNNYEKSNEPSYCGTSMIQDHYHNCINCM